MSLVLTVDWPTGTITVTVVDIAAQSIVADGRASTDSNQSTANSSDSWLALCEATQTALDGLAALSLTTDDIRHIELTDALPDELCAFFLDPEAEVPSVGEQIGILSASAAQELGLALGCPVHRSTSPV
jgi:ribulose kinase